jgi:L-alanine-DL-glutamate epimerase-like enolase superfamily enzyme
MKITSIETIATSMIVNPRLAIVSAAGSHPQSNYLVVRIRTDESAEGFGEATVAPVWSGETQVGADAAGLKCIIGSNLEMDLGSAAMLHLAAAMPALCTTVAHDIIGPLYYTEHLTRNRLQFQDGCACVPTGPGLGISPDWPPQQTDRSPLIPSGAPAD